MAAEGESFKSAPNSEGTSLCILCKTGPLIVIPSVRPLTSGIAHAGNGGLQSPGGMLHKESRDVGISDFGLEDFPKLRILHGDARRVSIGADVLLVRIIQPEVL